MIQKRSFFKEHFFLGTIFVLLVRVPVLKGSMDHLCEEKMDHDPKVSLPNIVFIFVAKCSLLKYKSKNQKYCYNGLKFAIKKVLFVLPTL